PATGGRLNRDQKAAVIDEIAAEIKEADAIYAVDYRGISVPAAAELRTKLRDADATFRIVKNTLTERAADKAEIAELKELLEGPTALTFVRGDAALAAKALRDQQRTTETLAFKGGFMNGEALSPDDINSIARLPAREVLYGQLVGIVASPITGLARGLGSLLGGLAVALGQVQAKKESGEIPAGEAPAAEAAAPAAEEAAAPEPDPEAAPADTTDTADQDAEAPEPAASTEEPAEGADDDSATEA
ncbi:MAG TPA: 50S ribosomal protein L10, partial [Solirubrobacteraceae bacterium]|nr:50S ribosomal protein L10 [Solirubrobacteraceae bacterium]